MHAYRLKEIDEERKRYETAYLSVVASATKKDGKPQYKNFKDFYDYEKRLAEVEEQKTSRLSQEQLQNLTLIAQRRKEFREGRRTLSQKVTR